MPGHTVTVWILKRHSFGLRLINFCKAVDKIKKFIYNNNNYNIIIIIIIINNNININIIVFQFYSIAEEGCNTYRYYTFKA